MKHFHGACGAHFNSDWYGEVLLGAPGESMLQIFNPGSYHEDKRVMEEGEKISFTIYSHFVSEDLLPHDWSLVAWSSIEQVEINYVGGKRSDAWEVQSLSG